MNFQKITSRKNKLVLLAASLKDKKIRDAEGLFFTEGKKIFSEAREAKRMPEKVFVTDLFLSQNPDWLEILSNLETYEVTEDVYLKITDEKSPEGIFAIFKKEEVKGDSAPSATILLEGIQDPGNLGTLLRSAVAFGVRALVTVNSADVYNPKTVRSTMGAIFKIPVYNFENIDSAITFAREISQNIVASTLSEDSVPLNEVDTSFSCIMIGSEGRGLTKRAIELSDKKVIIPIQNIESLNASVAGAIMMYDSMTKRNNL